VVDQILIAKRDAEHPLRHHGPDRVLDLRLGATIGEAGGEPSDQTDRPIAPSNSAPASEVTSPPSNAATIWRPSTPSYPNRSRLQYVGIGELLWLAITLCRRRTIADSEPRCTYSL
jgi:hypothetical protein